MSKTIASLALGVIALASVGCASPTEPPTSGVYEPGVIPVPAQHWNGKGMVYDDPAAEPSLSPQAQEIYDQLFPSPTPWVNPESEEDMKKRVDAWAEDWFEDLENHAPQPYHPLCADSPEYIGPQQDRDGDGVSCEH